MPSIEQRLKTLEKHARADTERWQALSGEVKAITSIFSAMFQPICATNLPLGRTIIKNMKISEQVARAQNEHAQMLVRLRYEREFYESVLKKLESSASGPANNGAPQRRR